MNSDDITVVVTTAPRVECYLKETLYSIKEAGWQPVVFAEPGSTKTEFQTITWDKKQGLWHNWQLAAKWAMNTESEYIMTIQDDCYMHPDTKNLLDQIPDLPSMGYLSLYTPSHYQDDQDGNPIKGLYTVSVTSVWGALALIFHKDTLRQLLDDVRAKEWIGIKPKNAPIDWRQQQQANPDRIKNSDYIIGSILHYSMSKHLYYLSPSPCRHIARYSSVGHSGNSGKRNTKYFAEESKPLFPQIFENELSISKIGDLRISNTHSRDSVYYHPESMQGLLRERKTQKT
jgi:hypothetical protein